MDRVVTLLPGQCSFLAKLKLSSCYWLINKIQSYFKGYSAVAVKWCFFFDFDVCSCDVSVQILTMVCRPIILFLVLILFVVFEFLTVGCFGKLLPHQIWHQLTTDWWNGPEGKEKVRYTCNKTEPSWKVICVTERLEDNERVKKWVSNWISLQVCYFQCSLGAMHLKNTQTIYVFTVAFAMTRVTTVFSSFFTGNALGKSPIICNIFVCFWRGKGQGCNQKCKLNKLIHFNYCSSRPDDISCCTHCALMSW